MIRDNIKNLRQKHHLTQAELGRIAGVSNKAVSAWESGYSLPRMGAVEKMAAYFGVPKSEIVDEDPTELTQEELVLIYDFRDFDREMKNRLMSYMNYLKQCESNDKE